MNSIAESPTSSPTTSPPWHPMDTAPRDGRLILLHVPYPIWRVPHYGYVVGRWGGDDLGWMCHGLDHIPATGWAPVPDVPGGG